ncbi:MAG: cysteine desulfurase family protein, partial [Acidimicrobiales bacterium]
VVFTSGATEAVNAATYGAASGRPAATIVCSAVEHSCVLDSSARHRRVVAGADRFGRVDAGELLAEAGGAALVHLQWGNHEVGTLQPVAEVVAACRERGVLVHVDAAQAAGRVPVDFAATGADLLSVSAHKFGGPPGIGALLVRRGLRLAPWLVGGAQERARRGGMENLPAIAGFGAAAAAAGAQMPEEDARARAQTRRVLSLATEVPGVVAYGDLDRRLPHIACLGVEGVEAEAIVLGLDQAGVAVHSGSACSSETLEPSPVLAAMGVEAERSVRVSVGGSTTDADIEAFCAAFPKVVARLRALRTAAPVVRRVHPHAPF